jgi:hypothetical protein
MAEDGRAYAHYMRAKMYTKYGDEKKAKAHMGRAMRYGGSTRFGVDPVVPGDPVWRFNSARVNESRHEDELMFHFVNRDGSEAQMLVKGLASSVVLGHRLQYIIWKAGRKLDIEEASPLVPELLNAMTQPHPPPAVVFKYGPVWEEIEIKTGPATNLYKKYDTSYVDKGNLNLPFSVHKYTASDVFSKLVLWKDDGAKGADYEVYHN